MTDAALQSAVPSARIASREWWTRIRPSVVLPVAVVLVGCGGEPTTPEVDNAGLARTAVIDVGQSVALTHRLGNTPVFWTVSDPYVAQIDQSPGQGCSILLCTVYGGASATVYAIAPGQVTVTVGRINSLTDPSANTPNGTVTVTTRGTPVASIRVLPDTITLRAGGGPPGNQAQLRAQVLDAGGRPLVRFVRWAVSDPTLLSGLEVSAPGSLCCAQGFLVFGAKAGVGRVTASAEGREASVVVRVEP